MLPRVSLTMIVKNEEANLPVCLASAADLVDEIIVVDTGSSDGTKAVASRLGARVFDFPWIDDFAAARNECLRHSTGRWIFWLDADDRIDEPNRRLLKALFAGLSDAPAGFLMKYLSPSRTGTSITNYLRLFPNRPDIRWKYAIHEQIIPGLVRLNIPIQPTDIVIHHTGYEDPTAHQRKLRRNLRLLESAVARDPDDVHLLFNLGWNYMALGQPTDGVPVLTKCIDRCPPDEPRLRMIHQQLARGYCQLQQLDQALAACQAGLKRFPDDAELRFLQAAIHSDQGDLAAAERCLLPFVKPGARFACTDVDLPGCKAAHTLAMIYRRQKRFAEAEALWRQVIQTKPQFALAWLAMADMFLEQARWEDVERTASHLANVRPADPAVSLLRARVCLARSDWPGAKLLLRQIMTQNPGNVALQKALTAVLKQDGRDPAGAQAVLRNLLASVAGQSADAQRPSPMSRETQGG